MRETGFSLIEVVVALAILGLAVLGFAASTGGLARAADESGQRLAAVELLQSRLRLVAMDPDYGRLETRYEGVDSLIAGFPGYRRTTTITRVVESKPGGRVLDYQRVMVRVEGPGLLRPLTRTITIAAP